MPKCYAIVEGLIETGVGTDKEVATKLFVIGGADSRSHAEDLAHEWIEVAKHQRTGFKTGKIQSIHPYRR